MPTIIAQPRASITGQTDDAWRAPVKTILAASTGMHLDKPQAATPALQKNGQSDTSVETGSQAVTLSPQLTALARKEAKLRQQELAFKASQEAMKTKESEFSTYATLKDRLAKDDFAVLDELGVSYEKWTNHLLSKGETERPEIQAINQLKEELSGLKASQESQINKQFEATKAHYRSEIKSLIEKDPEFSTVKELKADEYVLQHIVDTFNEDGETLTVEQAAKEVEDALVEDAMKMAGLSKIKAKTLPSPTEKKLQPPRSGLRTLSSSMAPSTTDTNRYPQMQHLSMKERMELAMQKAQKTS